VVLDLTQFLAGPTCTQILGDLGARVLKVEPPAGDSTRDIPPHYIDGSSAYFLSVNRNKESIVVDLKNPAGRTVIHRLAARANVFVENFRPGVADRLGVGFADIARTRPDIVYCSLSGFGANGMYRDRPAYDIIVQAMSGAMSLTGEVGGNPVRLGIPVGDLATGMNGAIAILAALLGHTEGKAQRVEISMLDTSIALLSYLAQYHLTAGVVPGPQGSRHESIATYRLFECKGGTAIIVAANTERMWRSLCDVLDLVHLVQDERFASNQRRVENQIQLWEALELAFARRSATEWLELLSAQSVPAALVNDVGMALSDPVVSDSMVEFVRDGAGVNRKLLTSPLKGDVAPRRIKWPPSLGAQTKDILETLGGYTPAEIDNLQEVGAIVWA